MSSACFVVSFGFACVVKYVYSCANQSASVGSTESFPAHFDVASSWNVFGGSLTRFVFQATTNSSSRSAVNVSNRYFFGIWSAYGEPRYGIRTFALCWKISMFVPLVSITSAPLVFADVSARTRAVTSSLEPRYRFSFTSG